MAETMTYQPTAKDFDDVINEFWHECDVADDERLQQIGEVIAILTEEKFNKGCGITPQDAIIIAREKFAQDDDGKAFEIWYNHEVKLEPNFAELEEAIIGEFC